MDTYDENRPQEKMSPFVEDDEKEAREREFAISEKQVDANRRNAQRSTGPKTPEGKARVAVNAVKHGLCTNRPVIPGENPAEFDKLRIQFLNDLRASDAVERAIAERIALTAWRLRRVTRYEASLMRESVVRVEKAIHERREFGGEESLKHMPEANDPQALFDRAVATCLAGPAFQSLMRYEAALERGMFKALKELRELWKTGLNFKLLSRRPAVWEPPTEESDLWWEYPDETEHQTQEQTQTTETHDGDQQDQDQAPETKQSHLADDEAQVFTPQAVGDPYPRDEYAEGGGRWSDTPPEVGDAGGGME